MDDASKLETYKAGLRLRYANNVAGLKAMVASLMDGAASDEVLITSHNFSDGGSSGQVVLEPMVKLSAALAVLAELDADSAALVQAPSRIRYADFSQMATQT